MNKPYVNEISFVYHQNAYSIVIQIVHKGLNMQFVDMLDDNKEKVLQRGYELCELWDLKLSFPVPSVV